MEHHMKPLDKAEIDKLINHVTTGRPDLDTLEKLKMASLSHLGHLHVMDNVTLKELSAFWGICRNSVRRRLKEKVKLQSRICKIVEKSQKAEIKLSSQDAFPDICEYINFLKWRSVHKKADRSISVSEAAKILGVSRPTIYRYIKTGELHKSGADGNRIMRFSFYMFVQSAILETEVKLNILKKFIQNASEKF